MDSKKQVNPEIVINQLFTRLNQLTAENVLKDAYIAQLEAENKSLSSKAEEPEEKK